ncbi:hypothetical protein K438DRAFT_1199952 [Mycena galopus ATCC 62051]|nr:hypothetical protein K438DRAFT_1199952 [Mycena galopus ATCC 62051]
MYGIERRAVLAFPCVPPPPSVPLRYRHRAAALRLQRPPCAIQRCLLLPLTSVLPLFAVLPRLFSCPFPKDPALFLQTKIIVVLAIHLPTDSYPRHNLHVTELLEGSSTRYVSSLCFPLVPPGLFPSCSLNTCSIADSLTALSLAPTTMSVSAHGPRRSLRAMYIRTDFVQSLRRRVHPNPRPPSLSPPPTAFLKAYALLSHRPV